MTNKDRDRLRRKQDRLLAREIPRAVHAGIDPSKVLLSREYPEGPSLGDLAECIFPQYEATIDNALAIE